MYLLLDECCGRFLVPLAEALGHTVQRTIEVVSLGRQAPDAAIFAFARETGAIFVTVNRNDFISLAARGGEHPGIILIPSVTRRELGSLFPQVVAAAEPIMAASRSMFVEIKADGSITSFRI